MIGYVRCSTSEQADSGLGLAAQRRRIRAWAEAHDCKLVRIAEDAGVSGTVAPEDRSGLSAALRSLEKGEADGLVALKLDRLSRSVSDTLALAETFQRCQWLLATVMEQINTDSATGRLFINILASMAEWERDTAAERTGAALDTILREGRGRSRFTPFGWRNREGGSENVKGDRSKLRRHTEEQRALRRIVALREDGLGARRIAKELAQDGPNPRSGRPWTPEGVASILRRLERWEAAGVPLTR